MLVDQSGQASRFVMYRIQVDYNHVVFSMPPVSVKCHRCGADVGTIIQRSRGRGSSSPHLVRPSGDMMAAGIVVCGLCGVEIRVKVADMMQDVLGLAERSCGDSGVEGRPESP